MHKLSHFFKVEAKPRLTTKLLLHHATCGSIHRSNSHSQPLPATACRSIHLRHRFAGPDKNHLWDDDMPREPTWIKKWLFASNHGHEFIKFWVSPWNRSRLQCHPLWLMRHCFAVTAPSTSRVCLEHSYRNPRLTALLCGICSFNLQGPRMDSQETS